MSPGKTLAESIEEVGKVWSKNPYYERAEKLIYVFWDQDRTFKPIFDTLDLEHVVDLACGQGRHTEQFADKAGHVTLMDIHKENILACVERLHHKPNLAYVVNDGQSFRPLGDKSVSAIICYDAMVHFAPDVVESYILDAARVLKPGGKALLHHSNLDVPLDSLWYQNTHGRNRMTIPLFNSFVDKTELKILQQFPIPWGGMTDVDCVTLLEHPQS